MESEHGDMSPEIHSESKHGDCDTEHSDVMEGTPTQANRAPSDHDKEHSDVIEGTPTQANSALSDYGKEHSDVIEGTPTQANSALSDHGKEHSDVMEETPTQANSDGNEHSDVMEGTHTQANSALSDYGKEHSDIMEGTPTQANSDGNEHSDVIEVTPTKESGTPSDHDHEKEHLDMEMSYPTVTNFSISEILKPTFGLNCRTSQAKHVVDPEQARVIRNMLDVTVKRETNRSQELEHAYSQHRSVLFNFRCLKDKGMHTPFNEKHTCMGSKTETKRTSEGKTTSGTTEQTKRQSMKSLQINSDTGPTHENVADTSNNSSESIEKASGTSIDKSAVTSSNYMTSSISSERGPRRPSLWPAWVYCTRYSDRPSSGPRSRKDTRREKRADEKRPRTAFTNEQLLRLKSEFEASRYLTEQRRRELSRSLDLSEAQIKIWYQNKRAKMKKSTGASETRPLNASSTTLRWCKEKELSTLPWGSCALCLHEQTF